MIQKHTPQEITRAAVETAFNEFSREGIKESAPDFLRLLRLALEEHDRTVVITLTTPTGDAGPVTNIVSDVIRKKLDRPVEVEQKADPSIIGGLIISFGDERIDMSVRRRLEDVRRTMTS